MRHESQADGLTFVERPLGAGDVPFIEEAVMASKNVTLNPPWAVQLNIRPELQSPQCGTPRDG
jgi:hypothetical protein